MDVTTALLVMTGGALGAPLRYAVDRTLRARRRHFPWGTLAVNAAGSLLFGLLLAGADAGAVSASAMALLTSGFAGGLTTYSTFGYETVRLAETGLLGRAGVNVAANLGIGLTAATVGATAGSLLWG